ncbi:hypothetical protein GCM10027168_70190 [Streptomyces capparidis]
MRARPGPGAPGEEGTGRPAGPVRVARAGGARTRVATHPERIGDLAAGEAAPLLAVPPVGAGRGGDERSAQQEADGGAGAPGSRARHGRSCFRSHP